MGQHFSSLCLHHTFYPLICQSKSHSQDQSQYGKQLPKGMHTGWGDLLQPFLYISYQRKEEVKYLNQDLISNNQARVRRSAWYKTEISLFDLISTRHTGNGQKISEKPHPCVTTEQFQFYIIEQTSAVDSFFFFLLSLIALGVRLGCLFEMFRVS